MKKLKKFFIIINVVFLIFVYFKYSSHLKKKKILNNKIINKSFIINNSFSLPCECHKNIKIKVTELKEKYEIDTGDKQYTINLDAILTCNLRKSFKRGLNQKIISYSLYGNEPKYYNLLDRLIVKAKELYPDYTLRIYHDDSINKSIICQKECSNPNVEFCDIKKLPNSLTDEKKIVDSKYIHSMIWRFLPIGDSLVDLLMSRDLDSLLLQREFDSVKVWLKTDKIGHIMRGKVT